MIIDNNDLISIKRIYGKSIKNNKKSFNYKGNKILVSYAKYLIQYLENKFNISKKED